MIATRTEAACTRGCPITAMPAQVARHGEASALDRAAERHTADTGHCTVTRTVPKES